MSIKITIYSDFVCPFCFIGAGIIDAFRDEFSLQDTWVPHEIHPDTPQEGRDMTELFNQFDIDNITGELRRRGKPYSIEFGDITRLANSRLALEAAEFARDNDAYHRAHMELFKAYFTHGRDIGDRGVLADVVRGCGLDQEAMLAALDKGLYQERVRQGAEAARRAGVTAIPTFVIQGQPPITGAISETLFREALQQAASELPSGSDNK